MVRCVLFLNWNSFTPSHPHLSPDTQKMSRNLMTFPLEPGWLHWLSYDSRVLVEGFLNVFLFYITQHVWEYVQFDILETISADLRVCVSKKQMQMSREYVVWPALFVTTTNPTSHLLTSPKSARNPYKHTKCLKAWLSSHSVCLSKR